MHTCIFENVNVCGCIHDSGHCGGTTKEILFVHADREIKTWTREECEYKSMGDEPNEGWGEHGKDR